MTTKKNPKCREGGILVGTQEELPDDPRLYYEVRGDLIGCNRIYCGSCKQWVRHFDNVRLLAIALKAEDYRRLYESKDPREFDFIKADRPYRVYACCCDFAETPSMKWIKDLDADWACAGHPQQPKERPKRKLSVVE